MYKIKNEKLDYVKYFPIGIIKANLPEIDEIFTAYLEIVKIYTVDSIVIGYEIKFIYLKDNTYYDSLFINCDDLNIEIMMENNNKYFINLNKEQIEVNRKQYELLKKIQ